MTGVAYENALRPLTEFLLNAADADAARTTGAAKTSSAEVLADARGKAQDILAEARRQGAADAEAVRAGAQARTRREARSESLRVQRELYEQLRERSRVAVAALSREPGYARLRTRLAQAVWSVLGGDAAVADADSGGVTGSADGRRLDFSLAQFADRAVEEVAWRLFADSPAAEEVTVP